MRKSQIAGKKYLHLLVALIMVTAGLLGVSTITATTASADIGGDPGGYSGTPRDGGSNCGGCTSPNWNGGGDGGWSSPFPGVAAWGQAQRMAKTAADRGLPSPIGTYRNLTLTSNGANVGQQLDQQYEDQGSPCQAPIIYTINPRTGKAEPNRWGAYPSNAVGVRWIQTKNWNSDSSQLIESNISFNGCLIPALPLASLWKCPIKIDSVAWRGPYGKLVNTDDPKGQPTIVKYGDQPSNLIPDFNGEPNSVKAGVTAGDKTGWFYQKGKAPRDSTFARLWMDKAWNGKNVVNDTRAWNIIKSCRSIYADFAFNPAIQSNRSASATLARTLGTEPIGLVGNYTYTATYKYVVCTKISDGAYKAQVSTSNNTTTVNDYPAVTRYPKGSKWGCPADYNALTPMSKTSGMMQRGVCVTSDPTNLPRYSDGRILTPLIEGNVTSRGNPAGYPNERMLNANQANFNYNARWWANPGCYEPTTPTPCIPKPGEGPDCKPTTTTPCTPKPGEGPDCKSTPTPCIPEAGEGPDCGYTTVEKCDPIDPNCICYYNPPDGPTVTNDGKPINDNSQITAQGQKVTISWGAVPQVKPGVTNPREWKASFSVTDTGAYPALDGLDTDDPVKSNKLLNGEEIPLGRDLPATIDLNFFKGAALNKKEINAKNLTPQPFQIQMTRTFKYDAMTVTRTYRRINGVLTLVSSATVSQEQTGVCQPLTATLTVLDTRVANN